MTCSVYFTFAVMQFLNEGEYTFVATQRILSVDWGMLSVHHHFALHCGIKGALDILH